MQLKKIYYYDPIGIENNDKKIKSKIFLFLNAEINYDDNIELIKQFTYERIIESEVYDHIDSGVYLLRQVCKISLDHRLKINPGMLDDFRYKLLYLLFKNGVKISKKIT